MVKKQLLLLCLLLSSISLFAQNRYISRNASARFVSKAINENIEAINQNGISVIDKNTGQIELSFLMKGFVFEKALMQEHFNENYVESDLFPKATFKGKIDPLSAIDFSKDGVYTSNVSGNLQIHGVTKSINTKVNFTIQKGVLNGVANFELILSDYNIKIPTLVKDKIASVINISVKVPYQLQ